MTILDEIAEYARERVSAAKKREDTASLRRRALDVPRGDLPFESALRKSGVSFICECKKASPSKGIIAEEYDPVNIALDYERAGADAVSVLTEPRWFLGSDAYLEQVSRKVGIPVLRKDFTVDEYMLYEAKLLGAHAVLLIVSILSGEQIGEYLEICGQLGLSALVEIHDEKEAETAVASGARIIGVNNRNLKDFSVDTGNSGRLRDLIPENILFVSESGVKSFSDVENIAAMGADAVLVGETMMRAPDKRKALDALRGISG
ncbi:MAG: indole-3-glycerol phosphate synthase TrpC [Lachnospiraceae bacterium]|nr:indole-3-glycerol phosphate synthase TrpC [Lachnospiraceae bacterium]